MRGGLIPRAFSPID